LAHVTSEMIGFWAVANIYYAVFHWSVADAHLLHTRLMFTNMKSLHGGAGKYLPQLMFIHRVRKKEATLFSTITLSLLVEFNNLFTVGNRNEYCTITCNLLT